MKEIVNKISGSLDVNEAIIKPTSAFTLVRNDSDQLQQIILGSVQQQIHVYIVNDQILDNLFARHKERLYYIGYAYLSDVKVPLILRHFGDGPHGMGNDAYHTQVAAKTGGGIHRIYSILFYLIHYDYQSKYTQAINHLTHLHSCSFILLLSHLISHCKVEDDYS